MKKQTEEQRSKDNFYPLKLNKTLRNIPKFVISNYTEKNDLYNWLFNPAQDSASRPVGITGARG